MHCWCKRPSGPNHDTKALITAVHSTPITLASVENHSYNYMQFRTNSIGVEAGSVGMDGTGAISISSYGPSGAQDPQSSAFHSGLPGEQLCRRFLGRFHRARHGQGSFDFMFGTLNGIFAVDTSNGATLGLLKAKTKDFDPAFAGSYKAIFYKKTGAHTGQGNVETGTPSLGNATLVVGANGAVTFQDAQNAILAQGTLAPIADTSYLFGSVGELTDPCFGLFTLRVTTPTSQQDVFVTFQGRAALFSSFQGTLPFNGSNTYDYFYGVALK